jgi:hypothetical protein
MKDAAAGAGNRQKEAEACSGGAAEGGASIGVAAAEATVEVTETEECADGAAAEEGGGRGSAPGAG